LSQRSSQRRVGGSESTLVIWPIGILSGIGDNEGAVSSGWSWGPISLSLEAGLVSPSVPRPSSLTTPAKVSIYLPELQLMTESTMTATPAPAWDYVWFGGQPLAQIDRDRRGVVGWSTQLPTTPDVSLRPTPARSDETSSCRLLPNG